MAKFSVVQGRSAVDHVGDEVVSMCQELATAKKTRSAAIRHGEAVLRKVTRKCRTAAKAGLPSWGVYLYGMPYIKVTV